MTPDLDIAIIGLGAMGGEILRAALDTGILAPSRVGLLDPDPARIETFASLGCHPVGVPEAAAAPRLLLAVKPQVFPEVAAALRHASTPAPGTNPRASSGVTPPGNAPSRLAISVMAGLRSTRIAESLGPGTAVVRTMPNTPSAIRLGMTAIAPGPGATPDDLDWVRSLFTAVGGVVELDESHFHAVTAVSGSGPAWVFRMAEAWIAAAVAEGLPRETAERLVIETMFGAASLLRLGDRSPSELRTAVTSRGGTTAAGLAALDATGFDDAVQAAITAATARGRELDA